MARSPLALLVVLALVATGCIRGGDDASPNSADDAGNDTNQTPSFALPDDRGVSAAANETNVTEEGVGGVEHKHDYWNGKEQVVLFDALVFVGCPPCMPDGEGSQPKSVAYVKLRDLPAQNDVPALVYEGANRVEMLFGAPLLVNVSPPANLPPVSAPHPSAPKLFVEFRSAADSKWQPAKEVVYGTPISIDVNSKMTDMPHSTRSLWVFRLTTDRPEANVEVPFKFTVFKGRDVVDWPGHPEFYADKTHRVVMQQHVTTHMSGLESAVLYDSGGTWATPEKLISWGTKEIHVFINVTKVTNAYNADATGIFLEVHNATIIGPEITFGSRHFDPDPSHVKETQYALKVSEEGMDGPYQPESRWGFRAMATFAEIPGVTGLCPGCFPYDIEYDITVIATNEGTTKDE